MKKVKIMQVVSGVGSVGIVSAIGLTDCSSTDKNIYTVTGDFEIIADEKVIGQSDKFTTNIPGEVYWTIIMDEKPAWLSINANGHIDWTEESLAGTYHFKVAATQVSNPKIKATSSFIKLELKPLSSVDIAFNDCLIQYSPGPEESFGGKGYVFDLNNNKSDLDKAIDLHFYITNYVKKYDYGNPSVVMFSNNDTGFDTSTSIKTIQYDELQKLVVGEISEVKVDLTEKINEIKQHYKIGIRIPYIEGFITGKIKIITG